MSSRFAFRSIASVLVVLRLSCPLFADSVGSDDGRSRKLVELASHRFSLSAADHILLEKTAIGEVADFTPPQGSALPELSCAAMASAIEAPSDRAITAQVLAWLCRDAEARRYVTSQGIHVKGAEVVGPLDLNYVVVPFPLQLEDSVVRESFDLSNAQLSQLLLSGTRLGRGLNAGATKVGGSVFLEGGFVSCGTVNFIQAKIGGSVQARRAAFLGGELQLDRAQVEGNVSLAGATARRTVTLAGSRISGDLDCTGTRFLVSNPIRCDATPLADRERTSWNAALAADRMTVDGNLYLRRSTIKGAVLLRAVVVKGYLVLTSIPRPRSGAFDLRSLRVGSFLDDPWCVRKGRLRLTGFVYDELVFAPEMHGVGGCGPPDRETDLATSRLRWLGLQSAGDSSPQPFEQLAAALRRQGYDADARRVMMEKERQRVSRVDATRGDKVWRFLGWFIGYGYRPLRAFYSAVVVVLVGTVIFWLAHSFGVLVPAKECAYSKRGTPLSILVPYYPPFNAFFYSLDVFTPLIDLAQSDYWMPGTTSGENHYKALACKAVRYYSWAHVIIGWMLSTLLAVGVTGIVRQ